MFDSPFAFCTVCRQYVLLDQTQAQCAHEHECGDASACALRRYFTGFEFGAGRIGIAPSGSKQRSPPNRRRF